MLLESQPTKKNEKEIRKHSLTDFKQRIKNLCVSIELKAANNNIRIIKSIQQNGYTESQQ